MSSERAHDGTEPYGVLGAATPARGGVPSLGTRSRSLRNPPRVPVKQDHASDADPAPDEPVSVVPFPVLDPGALHGLPGKIVEAVEPHTEAHPAAILVQFLARFGATIGDGPHVWIANRKHPARIWPLIVGRTSDGAKGTGYAVVEALFEAAERGVPEARRLTRVSGLSSGEGLIELVRDDTGADPDAKGFDEGVHDKRLLVIEEEFTSALAVMERQGSTLPRVLREAWDGGVLRTLTRSALKATHPHITMISHVTPGELRIRLKEAQLVGGTMNRTMPVASRQTKLLPEGGNIPPEVLEEHASSIADAVEAAARCDRMERTEATVALWAEKYPELRRARSDGPVASTLARAAPQVLRTALAYALADNHCEIDHGHLTAALAIWRYVEDTAEWMFGARVDRGEVEALVSFIKAGGTSGRTKNDIYSEHYQRNKPAAAIGASLAELIKDGRVRQEVDRTGPGRPATRFFPC